MRMVLVFCVLLLAGCDSDSITGSGGRPAKPCDDTPRACCIREAKKGYERMVKDCDKKDTKCHDAAAHWLLTMVDKCEWWNPE